MRYPIRYASGFGPDPKKIPKYLYIVVFPPMAPTYGGSRGLPGRHIGRSGRPAIRRDPGPADGRGRTRAPRRSGHGGTTRSSCGRPSPPVRNGGSGPPRCARLRSAGPGSIDRRGTRGTGGCVAPDWAVRSARTRRARRAGCTSLARPPGRPRNGREGRPAALRSARRLRAPCASDMSSRAALVTAPAYLYILTARSRLHGHV